MEAVSAGSTGGDSSFFMDENTALKADCSNGNERLPGMLVFGRSRFIELTIH